MLLLSSALFAAQRSAQPKSSFPFFKKLYTYVSPRVSAVRLSGLEWILNLEFCLLKLLIFYQKLLWCISSRLNQRGINCWVLSGLTLPYFEFLSLYLHMFDQNLHLLSKKLQLWSNICKYRFKNSKRGRVGLDLDFHYNFW